MLVHQRRGMWRDMGVSDKRSLDRADVVYRQWAHRHLRSGVPGMAGKKQWEQGSWRWGDLASAGSAPAWVREGGSAVSSLDVHRTSVTWPRGGFTGSSRSG